MPTMPRKASQPSPEAATIVQEIQDHCARTNTSVLSLSKQAGVQQSALTRFLSGERKTVTTTAKKVMAHLGIRHNQHNRHNDILDPNPQLDEEGCRLINSAIRSLWDGRRQSAELIASLVVALKPALEIAARPSEGGQNRN
jgi:hypothetical protein